MVKENNNYSVLVVHPGFSKHICRFIRRLKLYNKAAHIDFLTFYYENKEIPSDITENTNDIFYIKLLSSEKCSIKLFRLVYDYFHIRRQIRLLSSQHRYDVINVHYPNMYFSFGAKFLKKMCRNLLITPWGSDVYQLHFYEKFFIKKLYDVSDNVTGVGNKFTKDYQAIFGVVDEKIVKLAIGSETADYFFSHKDLLTKDEAKEKIGIKGYYGIVTCYNGNPIGHHIEMFEAIKKIMKDIPEPIMILVQITYGYTEQYLTKLKKYIKDNNLDAIFFEKYLSLDELYCLMMSADMFIFVSDSDSNSAVLKEYLYLGKKVVLGEWLKYDDLLCCNPLPYFTVKSLTTLSDSIKEAYFSDNRSVDTEWKLNFENAGYNYWTPKWDEYYRSVR